MSVTNQRKLRDLSRIIREDDWIDPTSFLYSFVFFGCRRRWSWFNEKKSKKRSKTSKRRNKGKKKGKKSVKKGKKSEKNKKEITLIFVLKNIIILCLIYKIIMR